MVPAARAPRGRGAGPHERPLTIAGGQRRLGGGRGQRRQRQWRGEEGEREGVPMRAMRAAEEGPQVHGGGGERSVWVRAGGSC